MRSRLLVVLFTFILCCQLHPELAAAGEISFGVLPGVKMKAQVASYPELKQRGVVRASLDESCGAASLATILQFYYGDNVSESDVVRHIERLRETSSLSKSFSLLDFKKVAEERGYKATGLKGNLEALRGLAVPIIVRLDTQGFPHFVVIRQMVDDMVVVADPGVGNYAIGVARFGDLWNGILLAVESSDGALNQELDYTSIIGLKAPNHWDVDKLVRDAAFEYPLNGDEF